MLRLELYQRCIESGAALPECVWLDQVLCDAGSDARLHQRFLQDLDLRLRQRERVLQGDGFVRWGLPVPRPRGS